MSIRNSDLYNNQYCEEILILNIDVLSLELIIKTQRNLSIGFIDEYIFDSKYVKDNDAISFKKVCIYQPSYFTNAIKTFDIIIRK